MLNFSEDKKNKRKITARNHMNDGRQWHIITKLETHLTTPGLLYEDTNKNLQ